MAILLVDVSGVNEASKKLDRLDCITDDARTSFKKG